MAAGVRNAPDADPVRVHRLMPLQERNTVLVVADLRPGIEMLAIVAVADTKIAIVEDHGIDADFGEGAGINRHHDLPHVAPAAGQDHGRVTAGAGGAGEPGAASVALRLKLDIESFRHFSPG